MQRNRKSLRTQLILNIVFYWVLPILIVAMSGGYLLCRNYDRSMRQEVELSGNYAITQTESRLENVFFLSKSVSYDGVVRNAYRLYQIDGDRPALYRTVSGYLSQRFLRQDPVNAIFLSFWDEPGFMPYFCGSEIDSNREVLARYMEAEPSILREMANEDTRIRMFVRDGLLYAARNLLDSRLTPYATVVILCDTAYLSVPLASLNLMGPAFGMIDDIRFLPNGTLISEPDAEDPVKSIAFTFSDTLDSHTIALFAALRDFDYFTVMRDIPILVILAALLVAFLLISLLRFFSNQISRPVGTLVEAASLVRNGEWGYQITQTARNQEFETLYLHFNSMSQELRKQLDTAIEEQQTLHQARIKALQSQINPHFLNNTLEIINWEARLAGNERVTNMLEALSTMLNTSLNRDDSALITLREEMKYTEAYLYIIKQRMGNRLKTECHVDESLKNRSIPRMIIQPLVENAIEHDLSRSGSGQLIINIMEDKDTLRICVEHNGHILPDDRKKLDRLLSMESTEPGDRVHIGIRNVNQRLHLIYGDRVSLTINEVSDGNIRAEIILPA